MKLLTRKYSSETYEKHESTKKNITVKLLSKYKTIVAINSMKEFRFFVEGVEVSQEIYMIYTHIDQLLMED